MAPFLSYTPDNAMTHYTPDGIGNRIFVVSVLDPLPANGQDTAAWLEQMAGQLAPNYGKLLDHGSVKSDGDRANISYRHALTYARIIKHL